MIKRRNIPQQIADLLADKVISGQLTSGTPLREQVIASELDVARSSVREAFIILARNHLVELRVGKGARVAPLDEPWLTEIYELWYLLFETAAAHLTELGDRQRINQLRTQADQLASLVGDHERQEFFDHALNLVIQLAELAERPLLKEHLMTLLPAAKRCYRVVLWNDQAEVERTRSVAVQLLDAAERGQVEQVRRAVRDYAGEQLKALRAAL